MCNVFAPVFCCNFTNKGSREALLYTWPTAKPINKNVINHCHLSIHHLRNCLFSLLLLKTQGRLINFVLENWGSVFKSEIFFQRENMAFKGRLLLKLSISVRVKSCLYVFWSSKRLCWKEFAFKQSAISAGHSF